MLSGENSQEWGRLGRIGREDKLKCGLGLSLIQQRCRGPGMGGMAAWECELQHRSCPLNSEGPELFSRIFQSLDMDHPISEITFQASPEKVASISPGQSSGEAWSCAGFEGHSCSSPAKELCRAPTASAWSLQRHLLQWAFIEVSAYTNPSKFKQESQVFFGLFVSRFSSANGKPTCQRHKQLWKYIPKYKIINFKSINYAFRHNFLTV